MKKITVGMLIFVVVLFGVLALWRAAEQRKLVPPLSTIVEVPQPAPSEKPAPEQQQKLFTTHHLEKIKLPEGFQISVFAEVPDARSLAVSPSGVVFVSNRLQDKVYALIDSDKDGFANEVKVIAKGLNTPNGIALKNGDLYIATVNQILKLPQIESNLTNPPKPEVLYGGYPSDKLHGWKFIAFGPDGKLYVPVGAPCNNCLKDNPIYASITRLDLGTKQLETVAAGVRNSVGFDWQPETENFWFTDNGRDQMGDDVPTDELNMVEQLGAHFGFPFCHQGDVQDPSIQPRKPCSEFNAPKKKLSPHGAALGMRFYTGQLFPAEYQKQIFIAEHGSWNRKVPIGYRVMLAKLDANNTVTSYEPFADGWLQTNGEILGRPVDVAVWQDGSLLVTDDKSGLVYRITYN